MNRLCSRVLGVATGVLLVSGVAAAPVSAASGLVDGSLTAQGELCSWSDGVTSDVPPNALTVDRSTINSPGGNLDCTGDISASLNNDPTITFDDGNGSATVDQIDVTITRSGVDCQYTAENVASTRDGDTRRYTATTTVSLADGSFLCPDSAETDAEFSFR